MQMYEETLFQLGHERCWLLLVAPVPRSNCVSSTQREANATRLELTWPAVHDGTSAFVFAECLAGQQWVQFYKYFELLSFSLRCSYMQHMQAHSEVWACGRVCAGLCAKIDRRMTKSLLWWARPGIEPGPPSPQASPLPIDPCDVMRGDASGHHIQSVNSSTVNHCLFMISRFMNYFLSCISIVFSMFGSSKRWAVDIL